MPINDSHHYNRVLQPTFTNPPHEPFRIDPHSLLYHFIEEHYHRVGAPLTNDEIGAYLDLATFELCPARCIHPGKPRSDDSTATPELLERASAFN